MSDDEPEEALPSAETPAAPEEPPEGTPERPPAEAPAPPPPAPEPAFEPRHPKALTLDLIVGGIVAAIFASALGLALLVVTLVLGFDSWVTGVVWAAAAAVMMLVSFFCFVYPRKRHRRYRYRAGSAGLEIHSGVWWRRRIHVPRSRLQHTDVAQGPLERQLGLASLVVYTAGTHDASVRLSGLSLEAVLEVRELLTGHAEDGADGV